MSYFIASSIVLAKNEIRLTGGDNNVVPRNTHHLSFPKTPQEWRLFVKQDMLGGCIRPQSSANDYFWWWILQLPCWKGLEYNKITDEQCDTMAMMIQCEWDMRPRRKGYAIQFAAGSYLKYNKGCFYTSKVPVNMSLYKATYVLGEYRKHFKGMDAHIIKL